MDATPGATHQYGSWPRRSSPLLGYSPFGTPPRRRPRVKAACLEPVASGSPRPPGGGSDDGDRWDADTVEACTPSPDASGYGRDNPPMLQMAQQRRIVDDLVRQLELREDEIAGYLRQIDELGEMVDDGRRYVRDGKQQQAHLEGLVVWYEEQLRLEQDRTDQAERAHQSALRHTNAEGRWVQTASAGDGPPRLLERIDALTGELEAAMAREEHARAASGSLAAELADARRAATQADEVVSALADMLHERCEYAAELERQLALREPVPLPRPQERPAGPLPSLVPSQLPSPPPVAVVSLFAEIAKATGGSSSTGCLQAAPPWPVGPGRAPDPARPEGALYWVAVVAHMAGALYVRIVVYPMLCIVAAVVRAALGFVAPTMLAHVNVALLLSRLGAAAKRSR
ncbi:hypothetical protein H4R19_002337 [Coemansia spiralis]|nr:hypothetical protein H4R19_002337 [Coemansia spiralis]